MLLHSRAAALRLCAGVMPRTGLLLPLLPRGDRDRARGDRPRDLPRFSSRVAGAGATPAALRARP